MRQLFCKRLLLTFGMIAVLGTLTVVLAQTTGSPSQEVQKVEESPLLEEPETPEELFETTVLMVDLARPGLARAYLDKLMEMNPDDALLLKLREKHGPAVFLRLANVQELKPVSSQLLERVNRLFRAHQADPAEIDKLIAALSASPQQREVAIVSLRDAGPVVVPRFLQRLASTERPEQRDLLVHTLTKLGDQVVPALLGGLVSPNEELRVSIIDALGWLGSLKAVPYLWYPAFASSQEPGTRLAARRALGRILNSTEAEVNRTSTNGVANELKETAIQHFRYDYRWDLSKEDEQNVNIWTWNPQTQTVELSKFTPEAASLFVGSKFARQALELSPDDQDLQALVTAMSLGSAMHASGETRRLPTGPGTAHDLALTAGDEIVSRALRISLNNSHAEAAVSALQVLSQIATKHQLYKNTSKDSPLTSALNYPDLQVQFAAVQAILQLDPDRRFPGSERVVSILSRALNDEGSSRGVAVHGNAARASDAAGLLGEIGFDALPVTTGRDAFRMACERGDVELILLNVNTGQWGLSQTVANLRADARTAAIPIAIYGPEETRSRVQSLLEQYATITYLNDFTSSDYLEVQIRPFLQSLKSTPLSGPQRAQRKATAAFWITHIANGRRTDVFDLRPAEKALIGLVSDPELATQALLGLGAIPTADAQRQLQVTSVSEAFEIKARESAALQLAYHIQRFGLLLSQREITEIHDAWKSAEDPRLATALASVIGSLKPDKKRVSSLLRTFPTPTAPVTPAN